ncbi:aminodeoxychorismate synthase component I [Marinobacter subterrani]|uniref:Aminodeoxychorismate synthase, component I, bacterial clade n=1 Tax=Marinobacter subterrani TaxID=1658765 RepID=A0A0J7J9I3_9GAMM|nr:aminodeoxychorismate synthase component I [Marinobacter subterrani]KMQ74556.1 aminodeoxychorismate synthase, component I, bacterial clade [Marinobacter subterrani]
MRRSVSREIYERLLHHARGQTDFAYIGSVGAGPGRGDCSGFSACALSQKLISRAPGQLLATDALAEDMEALAERYRIAPDTKGGFLTGGWMGVLSYELGYVRERRLADQCPELPVPLCSAGFYLWAASHNRQADTYRLWIHPECPKAITEQLDRWMATSPPAPAPLWHMTSPFLPRQSAAAFRQAVQSVRRYIEAGDCYQANLSQEFSGRYTGDPWLAFQALARANPTPYSGFIRTGEAAILSISPERFLEIHGRTVTTSPIKGTRPRGRTSEEDADYAAELKASAKDLAENLMIVDLLRNDLSLNAKPGSVKVDKLFALESYRNVHHLVSHIRAELADGVTPMKALFDAFPGGSITGAPKIRAMEIIRELEPHWRGPYCGSIFYRGLDGTLDSNIAIRTMLCDGKGTIRCWGGGGIVADSDPEAEYQETLAKVGPLMRFLEELVIE